MPVGFGRVGAAQAGPVVTSIEAVAGVGSTLVALSTAAVWKLWGPAQRFSKMAAT